MNRLNLLATACAAALIAGSQAKAAEAPPGATMVVTDEYRQTLEAKVIDGGSASFAQMDKNRDGAISGKEFGKKRAEAFKDFDTNGDGAISSQEHRRGVMRRNLLADIVLSYMLRWDVDRDGLLSKYEFRGRPAAFVSADKDENNVLHHGELLSMLRSGKPVQYSPIQFVKSHDLDRDGRIDRSEWDKIQTSESLFNVIDSNGDTILSKSEVEKFLFRYERRLAPLPGSEEEMGDNLASSWDPWGGVGSQAMILSHDSPASFPLDTEAESRPLPEGIQSPEP